MLTASGRVKDVTAYADSNVDVRLDFAPARFPESAIVDFLIENQGEILKSIRLKDPNGIQIGSRIYNMARSDLNQNPIPSFLYFGRYKFQVRYSGQQITCTYCADIGHKENRCPKKYKTKQTKLSMRGIRKIAVEDENLSCVSTSIEDEPKHVTANDISVALLSNEAETKEFKEQSVTSQAENNDEREMFAAYSDTAREDKESTAGEQSTLVIPTSVKINSKETLPISFQNSRNKKDCTTSESENESRQKLRQKKRKLKTGKRTRDEASPQSATTKKPNENLTPNLFSVATPERNLNEVFFECCLNSIRSCKDSTMICECNMRYFKFKCEWRLIDPAGKVSKCDTCQTVVVHCPQCLNPIVDDNEYPTLCKMCDHPFDLSILV